MLVRGLWLKIFRTLFSYLEQLFLFFLCSVSLFCSSRISWLWSLIWKEIGILLRKPQTRSVFCITKLCFLTYCICCISPTVSGKYQRAKVLHSGQTPLKEVEEAEFFSLVLRLKYSKYLFVSYSQWSNWSTKHHKDSRKAKNGNVTHVVGLEEEIQREHFVTGSRVKIQIHVDVSVFAVNVISVTKPKKCWATQKLSTILMSESRTGQDN